MSGPVIFDSSTDSFAGFEDNHYQHSMHTMANITLWTIVVLGVAAGIFGIVWGYSQ